MNFIPTTDPLWQEIAAIAEDEALALYDLERVNAGGLRVTIDRKSAANVQTPAVETDDSKAQRVSSDDCTRLCRRLMVYFLAEGERFKLPVEPEIEVASPGINRTLRLPRHWEGALGERVRAVFSAPLTPENEETSPAKRAAPVAFTIGELLEVTKENATILDEQLKRRVTFPLTSVKRGQVDFKF